MLLGCIQRGHTALILASELGNEKLVQMLIDGGANKDIQDRVQLHVYRA